MLLNVGSYENMSGQQLKNTMSVKLSRHISYFPTPSEISRPIPAIRISPTPRPIHRLAPELLPNDFHEVEKWKW